MLDRLGLIQQSDADVAEGERRKDEVLNPQATEGIREKLAAMLGVLPQADERLGEFWSRQAPRGLAPSLREQSGADIELPKERSSLLAMSRKVRAR